MHRMLALDGFVHELRVAQVLGIQLLDNWRKEALGGIAGAGGSWAYLSYRHAESNCDCDSAKLYRPSDGESTNRYDATRPNITTDPFCKRNNKTSKLASALRESCPAKKPNLIPLRFRGVFCLPSSHCLN